MKCVIFFWAVLANLAFSHATINPNPLSDEFINSINDQKTTWKAGRNFDVNTPKSQLKNLAGILPKSAPGALPLKLHHIKPEEISDSFDSREAWPECADIIGHIRDQADCAACWAFGAVEAMSDRICIHSNATIKEHLSAEDLLDCCADCGNCGGGSPEMAWMYWASTGIVTGGDYGSTSFIYKKIFYGCKAYSFAPCEHHIEGTLRPCGPYHPAPACKLECDVTSSREYKSDLRFGNPYRLLTDEDQIKTEIMTNGPVEAHLAMYEDHYSYKSGVYQHVSGDFVTGHAVKIIGWGVEDESPYWLVANSWNAHWGDGGYFKILRG